MAFRSGEDGPTVFQRDVMASHVQFPVQGIGRTALFEYCSTGGSNKAGQSGRQICSPGSAHLLQSPVQRPCSALPRCLPLSITTTHIVTVQPGVCAAGASKCVWTWPLLLPQPVLLCRFSLTC